jgi:hypothetical protein
MLEFLLDNMYVVVGGQVFQQYVAIRMGTNYAPFLADLFLHLYEAEFIQKLLHETKNILLWPSVRHFDLCEFHLTLSHSIS